MKYSFIDSSNYPLLNSGCMCVHVCVCVCIIIPALFILLFYYIKTFVVEEENPNGILK